MKKFHKGQLVKIKRPVTERERRQNPVWTPYMDRYDGVLGIVERELDTVIKDVFFYKIKVSGNELSERFRNSWLAPGSAHTKKPIIEEVYMLNGELH